MKTKLCIQVFFVALVFVGVLSPDRSAQASTGTETWVRAYSLGSWTVPCGLIRLHNGDYLVLSNIGTGSTWEAWLLRVDARGAIVWQKTLDSSSSNCPGKIIESPAGDILLLDWRLRKLNAQGELVWDKVYWDRIYWSSIAPAPDDGFVLAGGNSTTGLGYVIRIDSRGEIVWQRETAANNLQLVSNAAGQHFVLGFTGFGVEAVNVVFALDDSGALLWTRTLVPNVSYTMNPTFWRIALSAAGDLVLLATSRHASGDHYLFVKMDAGGGLVWSRVLPTDYYKAPLDFIPLADGGFLFLAEAFSSYHISFRHIELGRIDTNGSLVWGSRRDEQDFSTGKVLLPGAIAPDSAGGSILALTAYDHYGSEESDVALVKTDSHGLIGASCSDAALSSFTAYAENIEFEANASDINFQTPTLTEENYSSTPPTDANATMRDICSDPGVTTYQISGRVADEGGNPLSAVTLADNSGHSTTTDGTGSYTLAGLAADTYIITPSKGGYVFAPASRTIPLGADTTGQDFTGVPVSTGLVQAIHALVSNSHHRVIEMKNLAQQISSDGDYFSSQLRSDQVDLVVDGIVGGFDTIADASKTVQAAKEAALMSAPGVETVGWKHVVDVRKAHEPAKNAFREILLKPVTGENAQLAVKEFASGAHVYYAAEALNKSAEKLTTNTLVKGGLKILFQNSTGLQSQMLPPFVALSDVYDQDLDATRDSTLGNLPALSPAQEAEYIADFNSRSDANITLAFALDSRAYPLQVVRTTREQNLDAWWLPNFAERFVLKSAVALSPCDGLCVAGLQGLFTLGDLYKNWDRIRQDNKFRAWAQQGMGGAFETQKRIYLNTVNGLELLKSGTPPKLPAGQVQAMVGKSVGEYKLFGSQWWWEREAYSEYTYANTSDHDSRVQIFANYGKFGFLGAGYEPLFAEGVATVPAHQTRTVRVNYLQAEQGASPDAGSNIAADLVASTATGTYSIGKHAAQWEPTRIAPNGAPARLANDAAATAAEIPVLPYPIRSVVNLQSDTLNYVPQLAIDNPFTRTLHIVVTQPLPTDIQLVDRNGGTLSGSNLVWTRDITPQDTIVITHSIRYAGQAGTTLTYPAATLAMSDGVNNASFASESSSFQTQPPLVGETEPPIQMDASATVNLALTIRNRSTAPADGTIDLTLTASDGQQVFHTAQRVTVPGSGTVPVALGLTAPSQGGSYLQRATVTSGGRPVEIYSAYLDVTCAKPGKPSLVFPGNKKTVKPKKVVLDWSDVGCASSYNVLVRDGSKKGPKIQQKQALTVSQFKTKKLVTGKTYFWRVQACSALGCTNSAWGSFKIK